MSRKVDLTKRLSDEDKEYLHSRARGWEVEENERRLEAAKGKGEGGPSEEEWTPSATYPTPPFDEEPANPRQVPRPVGIDGKYEDRTAAGADVEEYAPEDLTVEELKDELHSRDLPVSGNKDELVKRLKKALKDEGS